MATSAQFAANRTNSEASTGPRTPEGKARSSQNAFKNGLASGRLIIPGEDPSEFNALLAALIGEHQPAMPTECILVEALAKHHWLQSRAQRLQAQALEAFLPELPPGFALLLRYETTHHRAFHKSLSTLLNLQKNRREAATGFVSQESRAAGPTSLLTPDSCLLTPSQTGFVSQESTQPTVDPVRPPDSCLLTPDSSPRTPSVRSSPKIGRNEPCPCGSGRKYKRCCLHIREQAA